MVLLEQRLVYFSYVIDYLRLKTLLGLDHQPLRGLNYRSHAAETGKALPRFPVFAFKNPAPRRCFTPNLEHSLSPIRVDPGHPRGHRLRAQSGPKGVGHLAFLGMFWGCPVPQKRKLKGSPITDVERRWKPSMFLILTSLSPAEAVRTGFHRTLRRSLFNCSEYLVRCPSSQYVWSSVLFRAPWRRSRSSASTVFNSVHVGRWKAQFAQKRHAYEPMIDLNGFRFLFGSIFLLGK